MALSVRPKTMSCRKFARIPKGYHTIRLRLKKNNRQRLPLRLTLLWNLYNQVGLRYAKSGLVVSPLCMLYTWFSAFPLYPERGFPMTVTSKLVDDNRPLSVVLTEREQAQARMMEAKRIRDEAQARADAEFEAQAKKDLELLAEFDRKEREEWTLELSGLVVTLAEKKTAFNKLNLEIADMDARAADLRNKLGPVKTTVQGVPTVTTAPVDVIVEPKRNELLWRSKSRSKGKGTGKVDTVRYGIFPETLNTATPECYDYEDKVRMPVQDYLAKCGFAD